STGFRRWLTRAYFKEKGRPPSSEALQGVFGVLEASADFDGETHPVHIRVAGDASVYYLDLGDPSWRAVKINVEGWELIAQPDVRFRRPKGFLALPEPARGGSLDLLKPFLNLREDDFPLLAAWLTSALCPAGPYPILSITGEQGSSKSTLTSLARKLIDPH